MDYVFAQGAVIGKDISSRLPEELDFELEGTLCQEIMPCVFLFTHTGFQQLTGVMWPCCFYKKKHYAAVMYDEHGNRLPELKAKGLSVVRNDRSLLNKRLSTTALTLAIMDNNPEGAVAYLREECRKLREGQLQIKDFMFSKQLHDLDPKTKSPHTALCRRLKARDPMLVPALGSKVEYVITKGHKELSEAAQRPEDVTMHDIDIGWYFDTQVLKGMVELLGPIINGGEKTLHRLLINDHNGQQTLYKALGKEDPAPAPQIRRAPQAPVAVSSKKQTGIGGAAPKTKAVKRKKAVVVVVADRKKQKGIASFLESKQID